MASISLAMFPMLIVQRSRDNEFKYGYLLIQVIHSCKSSIFRFAVKCIDKKSLKGKEDSLENEIAVLKRWVDNGYKAL